MAPDYYEILGISEIATDSEVEKAYRRLAMIYHPDRNPHASAEIKFKEIREAYEVLSDREGRGRYDRSRFERRQSEDDNDDIDAWTSDGRAAEHTNMGAESGGRTSGLWASIGVLAIGIVILVGIQKGRDSELHSETSKETTNNVTQLAVNETADVQSAANDEATTIADSPSAPTTRKVLTEEAPQNAYAVAPTMRNTEADLIAAELARLQQEREEAERLLEQVEEQRAAFESERRAAAEAMPAQQLLLDLSSVSRLERSAKPAQQPLPDLSRASPSERSMIEGACSYKKRSDGPASYYACLRSKAEELGRSSGPPDLSRASPSERSMIEGACSYKKRSDGPASYYACLRSKAEELGRSSGPPDLSRASPSERSMIEGACSYKKRSDGPASYYACLRSKAEELGRSSGPPDLSRASPSERSMIEGACSYKKRSDGPASYYACLRSKAEELGRSSGPPDLSRASPSERSMIEGACSYKKRSDGPASYYSCLRSKVEELGLSS